jgi:hypothetical protein
MDGRSHSPTRILVSAILVVAGSLLLLATVLARPARSAPAGSRTAAAKIGGTLRVNLSTTDVQYTDPSLEYESTGWQVEYATALKLLNWKETKAQLVNEAASRFTVAPNGKRYTFTIRPGLRLSNGEKITARNFQYAFQRATSPRMNSPAGRLPLRSRSKSSAACRWSASGAAGSRRSRSTRCARRESSRTSSSAPIRTRFSRGQWPRASPPPCYRACRPTRATGGRGSCASSRRCRRG